MEQINFTESNGVFNASITVEKDFNLHLESEKSGKISIYGSTVESGNKERICELSIEEPAFDRDFCFNVYPKYIDVVSTVSFTSAYITQ